MHLQTALFAVFSLSAFAHASAIESRDVNGDVLNAHNSFRAKHGAAPLKWSTTLAAAAQKWINNCQFKHSGGAVGPYGGKDVHFHLWASLATASSQIKPAENLAAGTGGFNGVAGVKMWTDEVSKYPLSASSFGNDSKTLLSI